MAPPVVPSKSSLTDDSEMQRRRRGRNWAMLVVLVGIAVLFYAIAVVKMARPTVGG